MMRSSLLTAIGFVVIALMSCATTPPEQENTNSEDVAAKETAGANPFFTGNPLPYNYPRFDQIEDEHFVPAFERGMAKQLEQIEQIANQDEPPTFENTIVALERSGLLLNRVSRVFNNVTAADTNEKRQEIRTEMAPRLAAHRDEILLNGALFERVQTLYETRDELGLGDESLRLVEEYYQDFVHAGAQLSEQDKTRVKQINAELASLRTQFSQNVLEEVKESAVVVDEREALAGLSEGELKTAAQNADKRGLEDKYLITLENTTIQPILGSINNRELRKRIMQASLSRSSEGGEYDNRKEFARIAQLRAERAVLMGYPNHAAYRLVTQTAQTPQAVNDLLQRLAPKAVANVKEEARDLQALIDASGKDFELEARDWAYYTEKLRNQRFDFDAAKLKPYLELNNVLENGVFYAANKLYGITFEERTDLPVYHPTVRVWEVFDADGSTLALFITDFYARPSKRGGAWMNAYVSQSELMGTTPVVANHLNVAEPPPGEPTLMTWDQVETMFHEFGHALHGMFSNVRFPYFSGTSVPRDFVEYPSQANEMWAAWPEVLQNYAVHYETGEPMPQELLDKVLAAQDFNQGYMTTEYLAAAMLDQAWHQLAPEDVPSASEVMEFEAQALVDAGVALDAVPPRYRTPYFSHIVGGYSAGYYAYIWSEVLAANTQEWFEQHGGLARESGDYYRETLLSQGGSVDAMTLFTNFYGKDPDIEPLLERRGLLP